MEGIVMLQRVVDTTNEVIGNTSPAQLSTPTLCTEWTVKDLINHMVGGATMFAVFDVATHAVDLARATGQHVGDTELLEGSLAIGKQMIGPALRAPGVFGDEQSVATSASAEDRLLAFAGRKL